ncbi:hypothetical protein AB0B45_31655 [Nonomuraea sp. NPDC049152]|uniref:hypothetical protein n=1 Tax=Nonomuraea sp. NPDC049152 TaxID=3154350 RepID=UPI0033E6C8C8
MRAAELRYLIRDRAGKFPALIEILADAGIQMVLTGDQVDRAWAVPDARPTPRSFLS